MPKIYLFSEFFHDRLHVRPDLFSGLYRVISQQIGGVERRQDVYFQLSELAPGPLAAQAGDPNISFEQEFRRRTPQRHDHPRLDDVDLFGELEIDGLSTRTGQFGAMMKVSLTNDGPVTLILSKQPAADSRS